MSEKYLKTREKLISKIENKLLKLNNSLKLVIEADAEMLFNQYGGAEGALDKLYQTILKAEGTEVTGQQELINKINKHVTQIKEVIDATTKKLDDVIKKIEGANLDLDLDKELAEQFGTILRNTEAETETRAKLYVNETTDEDPVDDDQSLSLGEAGQSRPSSVTSAKRKAGVDKIKADATGLSKQKPPASIAA